MDAFVGQLNKKYVSKPHPLWSLNGVANIYIIFSPDLNFLGIDYIDGRTRGNNIVNKKI